MTQLNAMYMNNLAGMPGVAPAPMPTGIPAVPDGFANGAGASRALPPSATGVSHPPVAGIPAPAPQGAPQQFAQPQQAPAPQPPTLDNFALPAGQAPVPATQQPAPAAQPASSPVIEWFRQQGWEVAADATEEQLNSALQDMADAYNRSIQQQQQAPAPQAPAASPVAPSLSQEPPQAAAPQHGEVNSQGQRWDANWERLGRWNAELGMYQAVDPADAEAVAAARSMNRYLQGRTQFQRTLYENPGEALKPVLDQYFENVVKPLQEKISSFEASQRQQQIEDSLLARPDLTSADPANPLMRSMTPKGQVFKTVLEALPPTMSQQDREEFAYYKATVWEQSQPRQILAPRLAPQSPVGQAMQFAGQQVPQAMPQMQQPAHPNGMVAPQTYNVRDQFQQQALQANLANNGLMGFGNGAGSLGSALAREAVLPPSQRPMNDQEAMRRAVEFSTNQGLFADLG